MTSGQPYQIGGSIDAAGRRFESRLPQKVGKIGNLLRRPKSLESNSPFLEDKKVLKGGHMLYIYKGDSLIS